MVNYGLLPVILDGGNPLRVSIGYEGSNIFDLRDKMSHQRSEVHDGSLYKVTPQL